MEHRRSSIPKEHDRGDDVHVKSLRPLGEYCDRWRTDLIQVNLTELQNRRENRCGQTTGLNYGTKSLAKWAEMRSGLLWWHERNNAI